jgi:hypothetical protein
MTQPIAPTLPGFPPPPPPTPEPQAPTTRKTRTAAAAIASGMHPFGGPLARNGKRCDDCFHAIRIDGYWKCERARVKRSEATDLRLKWPACTLFTATRPPGFVSPIPYVRRQDQRP